LVICYRTLEGLSFNISPGITFEGNADEINFALNLETAYEWKFGTFHLGPVFELAYDPEDHHIS